MRRFLILFLILTPIITKAQTNCSTGSWSLAGDLKAGPQVRIYYSPDDDAKCKSLPRGKPNSRAVL